MESFINKNNVTCIIPFYNEDKVTLRKTIYSLLKIPEITQIILVDDGSESQSVCNSMVRHFSYRYPVKVVRLWRNLGKATAVSCGLKKSFNQNILLVDADLENVFTSEFENAINIFKKNDLDMLILKRTKSLPLLRLTRGNTLLSGERIIKRKHLLKVLSKDVKGFQLEVAINQYFIDKGIQQKCGWSSSSAINNYKFKKINFFKGIYKDFRMYSSLIRYVGIRNYVNQILSFCK